MDGLIGLIVERGAEVALSYWQPAIVEKALRMIKNAEYAAQYGGECPYLEKYGKDKNSSN
jgi:hypothetical protein